MVRDQINPVVEEIRKFHKSDCSYFIPSARCSCGIHRVLTDLYAIANDADALISELKKER